jgi:Protein of unknown function (DUF3175)
MAMDKNVKQGKGYWSAAVTASSHALDLPTGLFKQSDPEAIAAGLLEAAEQSPIRKRSAYGSAMAMLCFYINRAGTNLSDAERERLNAAKTALRRLAGRTP